jgi:hypothetical protein
MLCLIMLQCRGCEIGEGRMDVCMDETTIVGQ